MPARTYLHGTLGLAAGLLGACDEPSRPRETASPEVAATVGTAALAAPQHYKVKGPYAVLYFGSSDGSTFRNISVDVQSTTDRQILLSYIMYECNDTTFECETLEEGYGLIPSADLTEDRGRLTLTTNTATIEGFHLFAGSGGPISLTWSELSEWSWRRTIQSTYRTENQQTHARGAYTSTAARAAGSLIGHELSAEYAYAEMGTVHEGSISMNRR